MVPNDSVNILRSTFTAEQTSALRWREFPHAFDGKSYVFAFTSAFICWNVLLSHVYLSLIYKNDLCLLFQLNFDIKKPTVLFFTRFEQQLLLNLKIQQGSFKIHAQNQHDS